MNTRTGLSVQPAWMTELSLQQQSVLFLAARGPDGIAKAHPCKDVQRAYRGTVLLAGRYGRPLTWGEQGDSFMCLQQFADLDAWRSVLDRFFDAQDALPHHYLMHLMHGAQILGYKHPDERFRDRWASYYFRAVDDLHLFAENERDMDHRLGDWGQNEWVGV